MTSPLFECQFVFVQSSGSRIDSMNSVAVNPNITWCYYVATSEVRKRSNSSTNTVLFDRHCQFERKRICFDLISVLFFLGL